ncbi:GGDEF domain-containing protein [Salinispirillum sp. LH 10-3-1]|uniref:diguanylate cyclase n=1 Tax=Salinispirillum sp. LH 10-3-1 TaxID=2952525 RepID=A0AB38YF35_9GAMM
MYNERNNQNLSADEWRDYRQQTSRRHIWQARLLSLSGAGVMLWLLVWDWIGWPEPTTPLLIIAGARLLLILLLLLTVLLSFRTYWVQRLHRLGVAVLLATVVGYTVMVSQGFKLGWSSPINGLLLVLLYLHAFLAIRFREKIALSLLLSVLYLLLILDNDQITDVGYQITFLLLTNVVVATISWSLEQSQLRLYRRVMLLEKMAHTDQLTGTLNRHGFRDAFSDICERAHRDRMAVGLFIIDIDHFKSFNDQLGHLEGDAALVAVAQSLMRARYHPADLVMRFGGEEFVCVFLRESEAQLQELAEHLRLGVENCNIVHPKEGLLTVSVGASVVEQPESGWRHGMMSQADALLYEAKEQGRNMARVAKYLPGTSEVVTLG